MSKAMIGLNQQFNSRDPFVNFFKIANYKVENNILANRFVHLNKQIKLDWLNSDTTSG